MAKYKLDYTGDQVNTAVETIIDNDATAGQVLTANGSGGASWQSPSAGGRVTVTIEESQGTEASFTLTSAQLTVLQNNSDILIKFPNTDNPDPTGYPLTKVNSVTALNRIFFSGYEAALGDGIMGMYLTVNTSNLACTMEGHNKVYASQIKSGSATAGQFLVANGSGGCSWQTIPAANTETF